MNDIFSQPIKEYTTNYASGYLNVIDKLHLEEIPDQDHQIQIFLPKDYNLKNIRYPVIYMNDGHTAFFPGGLANKSWNIDNQLKNYYSEKEALQCIIVAIIPNDRNREYTHDRWFGADYGGINKYNQYVTDHLKVFIDNNFRTRPGREFTMIMGSSHGGLAAFIMGLFKSGTFGFVAAMSPSFWVGIDNDLQFPVVLPVSITLGGNSQLSRLIKSRAMNPSMLPVVYMDWGMVRTNGPHNQYIEERAAARSREMIELLEFHLGYIRKYNLWFYEDNIGEHDEDSWGRRFLIPLRLFAKTIRMEDR